MRRHWIPPGALLFAQLAHGFSWALLALGAPPLAWVHVVALGWLSMGALGILIHVIPGFTGAAWKNDAVPRNLLGSFGIGVVAFVAGWYFTPLLLPGALLVLASVTWYYAVAVRTLAKERDEGKTEAAIARAMTINLSFFLVATTIGAVMTLSLASGWLEPAMSRLPQIHANLALFGWLTMLVFGVSARTVRPICGAASRHLALHILSGSAMLFGPLLVALGLAVGLAPVTLVGAALIGAGALAYVADTLDIVARAIVPHRPPQAFIVASLGWLVVALTLGAGLLAGRAWQSAFVFLMLVGWIGQMYNAHMLHIGIRLLITMIRGDDDETRPGAVLDARLSWLAFASMQGAVACVAFGLLSMTAPIVTIGASMGLVAWLVLASNVAVAAKRAEVAA